MPTKWNDGRVTRIEEVNDTVRRFWLKVDNEVQLDYQAGQFITIDLPISEKRLGGCDCVTKNPKGR